MKQDILFALRMLGKAPAFTAVAVLTLALGIGANSAIFSVIRHVLLNALPYRDAQHLAMIWLRDPEHNFPKDIMSYPRFKDTSALQHSFSGVAAFTQSNFVLASADEPEQVSGAIVSGGFFPLMGVPAKIGHALDPDSDQPGKNQVVVLSQGLWARRFGANNGVLGSKINLNSATYEVVGVMPSSFEFPDRTTELWIPLAVSPAQQSARGRLWLSIIARLKDGVSVQQATAELDALNRTLGERFPETDKRAGTLVNSLRDEMTENLRSPLVLLSFAVGCVLLIACANVASMMLARAAARDREISVRMALGAQPLRIARQVITESLVLFLIGGMAGVLLAFAVIAILVWLAPPTLVELRTVHMDLAVVAFGLGLAALTGIVFGLIPAVGSIRGRLNDALRQRGGSAGTQRLRHVMVMCQIAVAIVLLTCSGLLIRSFLKMEQIQLGFRPDHLLTFRVTVPAARYAGPKMGQFFTAVQERLRVLPGVTGAAATTSLLLGELPNAAGKFTIEGRAERGGLVDEPVAQTILTPGFLSTFGQPLLSGRDFNQFDGSEAPPVVLINDRMARRFWPNESPVGKRIKFGAPADNSTWLTIIGVAGDTRRRGLDRDIWIETYLPVAQQSRRGMSFIVRTAGDPASLTKTLRNEVRGVDPRQPIDQVAPMEQLLDDRIAPRRFHMLLLTALAATALVLASVGLYGVLAYLVTLRTQEIGVRMALGATPAQVLRLISKRSIALVGGGIVSGLLLSLASGRLMTSVVFGVNPYDPLTMLGAAGVVAIAAAGASFFPAQRATRVDPMMALRHE